MLTWQPPPGDHRQYIDCFPYIDGDGRLRLWDLALTSDVRQYINLYSNRLASTGLEVTKRGRAIVTALEPERVYAKSPGFFRVAQQLGYWKDVEIGRGAVQEVCPESELVELTTSRLYLI